MAYKLFKGEIILASEYRMDLPRLDAGSLLRRL
jgi:hypothetical protein